MWNVEMIVWVVYDMFVDDMRVKEAVQGPSDFIGLNHVDKSGGAKRANVFEKAIKIHN